MLNSSVDYKSSGLIYFTIKIRGIFYSKILSQQESLDLLPCKLQGAQAL